MDAYARLRDDVERDANVLGLILTGSQARAGMATAESDYDVVVVVADDTRARDWATSDPGLDLMVLSLADFSTHALPGSGTEWNRYAFVHSLVVRDTADGLVARLVAAKARLSPVEAAIVAPAALDGFLNAVYRCAKNARAGDSLVARLDGAEAVPPFLTYLFAVEARVRPYNKYLAWELARQPFAEPTWATEVLMPMVADVLTGDVPAAVQALVRRLEPAARAAGHEAVLDAWGADLAVIRGNGSARAAELGSGSGSGDRA